MFIRNIFNNLPVLNKVSMDRILKGFFSQTQVLLLIMEAIKFIKQF